MQIAPVYPCGSITTDMVSARAMLWTGPCPSGGGEHEREAARRATPVNQVVEELLNSMSASPWRRRKGIGPLPFPLRNAPKSGLDDLRANAIVTQNEQRAGHPPGGAPARSSADSDSLVAADAVQRRA